MFKRTVPEHMDLFGLLILTALLIKLYPSLENVWPASLTLYADDLLNKTPHNIVPSSLKKQRGTPHIP